MTTTITPPVPPGNSWFTDDAASPAPQKRRFRGAATRERLALAVLLAGTAVLYLWNLGASGYANEFYAAAVQAGTKSWKAFFFGSFDAANAITVDKPPASLWPMELADRIFGFSSWSMLVPQAIEGVLAVWVLYATVRRWFGSAAGLLAGALLALTPVAVLMFRFNNPDALMVLLIIVAAYCVTRAVETGFYRWTVLTGLVLGLSFLTKGLQPFTVVPALAAALLIVAPGSVRARALRLLAGTAGMAVGAGWWLLAVQLTPASERPYIGGSGDNSPLGLALGYNGVSRLTGSGAGGGPGGGFDGSTGIGRLFNSLNGGQIAWLLPAALIAVIALAVLSRRAARTDHTRAALVIWGGWLLVTGAVLSFAGGIIHTYYTVELAPAIAALVAIGTVALWRRRNRTAARVALAAGVLVTGWWSWTLLRRASGWYPEVSVAALALSIVAAGTLLTVHLAGRAVASLAVIVGLLAITGGSAAYAINTATTRHTGSVPSAGPQVSGSFGRSPGGFTPGPATGSPSSPAPGGLPGSTGSSGTFNGQLPSPHGGSGSGASSGPSGGSNGSAAASSPLVRLLKQAGTTWSAAVIGSQTAAPLELQSGTAVISIGGFTGSDNAPTLAQFQQWVREGKVHYYIAGGGMGGFPGAAGQGGSAASEITAWVEHHFSAKTVGGATVYDLTLRS